MEFNMIMDMIASFALGSPKLVGLCAVLFVVGIGLKIARDAIEKFILESPSKSDDVVLGKVKAHMGYKIFGYMCDLFIRLKKPSEK